MSRNRMRTLIFAYWNRPEKAAYLFVAPSLLVLILFTYVPVLSAVGISLFNLNMFFQNTQFAGLNNYLKAWQDTRVWNSFGNTFLFALGEVPLQVLFGLCVAAMVSGNSLFNRLLRSAFFIPVICSLTSIGIIWSLILDANIGIIPYFFQKLGLGKPLFLKDPNMAMLIIILLTVWKNFGHTMVILMAGIQAINPAYYEAAQVEGASRLKQFLQITIPLLIPNIAFCAVTNLIGSMQVFDQVYVATRGGPMFRTETAVQYIYGRAFSAPFQLGYASAIAVALFVIIMVCSLLLNRWFIHREEGIYA